MFAFYFQWTESLNHCLCCMVLAPPDLTIFASEVTIPVVPVISYRLRPRDKMKPTLHELQAARAIS